MIVLASSPLLELGARLWKVGRLFAQEAATPRSRGIASSFSNHLTLLFNETNTDFPGVVVRLCT
jgi:hypothetical protein